MTWLVAARRRPHSQIDTCRILGRVMLGRCPAFRGDARAFSCLARSQEDMSDTDRTSTWRSRGPPEAPSSTSWASSFWNWIIPLTLSTWIAEVPSPRTSKRKESSSRLADYLAFRHLYQHSYSFFLDWGELESLVSAVQEVWAQVKRDLQLFLDTLSSG